MSTGIGVALPQGRKRCRLDDDEDINNENTAGRPRKQKSIQKGNQIIGLPRQTQNDGSHSPPLQPTLSDTNTLPTVAGRDSHEKEVFIWQVKQDDGNIGDVDDLEDLPSDRQVAWLASSKNWGEQWFGANWIGKKVLGFGGNGLVGLWEHINPTSEEVTDEKPARVVVKQSRLPSMMLKKEARLLNLIKTQTGSKHVVGTYGVYYEEIGQGTITEKELLHYPMDPGNKMVGRLYLEYCENGDMLGLIRKAYEKYSDANPMPEEIIWLIFECLAKGLCVLAYGTEDPDAPPWNLQQIGHFDIKPENIFGGAFDAEHVKYQIMKIADFGTAVQLPKKATTQTVKWFKSNKLESMGTEAYKPPEQIVKNIPNRYQGLGTKSNVWQVAKCIYELIRLGREFDSNQTFVWKSDINSLEIRTFGRALVSKDAYPYYSEELKKLVLNCLAYNFANRPNPREVLRTCQTVLRDLRAVAAVVGSDALEGSLNRYPEPGDDDVMDVGAGT